MSLCALSSFNQNMEPNLYNSTICRLCSEENKNGSLLYVNSNENIKLGDLVNTYLPIKVTDDGILPRTICPGCTIQLEATTDFINLIINGQKILRELFEREKQESELTVEEVITDHIVYDISSTDGVYQVDHPIALQVAGLDKPKRKRGRPPKKLKTPEELAREEIRDKEKQEMAKREMQSEDLNGKRKRKAPTRLQEAVQGMELEKILKEEGVIDEEEEPQAPRVVAPAPPPKPPEVIGHVASSGEPVIVSRGKGRGRPKGRAQRRHWQCAICEMSFVSKGRYMSHVAAHRQTKNLNKLKLNEDSVEVDPPRIEVQQESSESSEPKKSEAILEIVNIVNCDDVSNGEAVKVANVNTNEVKEMDKTDEGTIVEITAETDAGACTEIVEVEVKDKKKYKCIHCPKTFSDRQSKSLHVKAVHLGERRYCCAECGARFAYPRSLKLHAITHRRTRSSAFGCDICGKVLNHPSSITYHKEAEHAGHRYVCRKCGKAFKHRQLLQRHQIVHDLSRPFTCAECNATFKTKANLTNHLQLHSGVKRFACEICNHKFAHKTSLILHQRWHVGLKPYECGACGKLFSQKGNLLEHERSHTGEKPFACDQCPRRFTTSSQCSMHVRRHRRCAECPRAPLARRRRKRKHSEPLALDAPSPPPHENVVYVTYDVDDPDALRMLHVEEVGSVMGEHVPVTDAHGNPLHFTMSDGTQLPITSSDGNTLQVITQDGQTLPVEIDGYTNEEEVDNVEIVIHQMDPQKTIDNGNTSSVTQYFTQ